MAVDVSQMISVGRSDCSDHPNEKEENWSSTTVKITYAISIGDVNHMNISMTDEKHSIPSTTAPIIFQLSKQRWKVEFSTPCVSLAWWLPFWISNFADHQREIIRKVPNCSTQFPHWILLKTGPYYINFLFSSSTEVAVLWKGGKKGQRPVLSIGPWK